MSEPDRRQVDETEETRHESESESESESDEEDPDVDDSESESEEDEEDPVFKLISENNYEAVREALTTDRSIVNRSFDDFSLLHHAISLIHLPSSESAVVIEMVKLLLSHGASVNSRAYNFETPLHEASTVRDGGETICELLLSNGARFNLTDDRGYSVLHKTGNVGVVKTLIR